MGKVPRYSNPMECTNDACGMRRVGRERWGVTGGIKKWVQGGGRKEKSFLGRALEKR